MKFKKFVFISPTPSTPEMGSGMIMCTEEPFYYGKVIRYKNDSESMHLVTNPPLAYSAVLGYSIYIVFEGSLTNKVRVNDSNWQAHLKNIFENMAQWYMQEKIQPNLTAFKRFKL